MGCARSTPAKPPAEAASASSTKPSAEPAAYAPARLPTLNTTTTSPSAAAVQIPTQCGALAQPPAAPSETVAPPDDPIAAVHVPTQAEALAAWDARLRAEPVYKKCQLAHAKQTEADGNLETWVNGKLESVGTHAAGDWIIQGPDGERYNMAPAKFAARYDVDAPQAALSAALVSEGFAQYVPKGKVWAKALSLDETKEHFPSSKFIAAWGSEMLIEPGDILAMPYPAGGEVYRIEASVWRQTYTIDDDCGGRLAA